MWEQGPRPGRRPQRAGPQLEEGWIWKVVGSPRGEGEQWGPGGAGPGAPCLARCALHPARGKRDAVCVPGPSQLAVSLRPICLQGQGTSEEHRTEARRGGGSGLWAAVVADQSLAGHRCADLECPSKGLAGGGGPDSQAEEQGTRVCACVSVCKGGTQRDVRLAPETPPACRPGPSLSGRLCASSFFPLPGLGSLLAPCPGSSAGRAWAASQGEAGQGSGAVPVMPEKA